MGSDKLCLVAFVVALASLCHAGSPQAPVNDDCANAIEAARGVTRFTTVGATTDGPAHPECGFCCGDGQINHDIWFRFTSNFTDLAQIECCASDFDTKIAIYEGCGCPVGDLKLLACNDDLCGLQSLVTAVPFTNGNCYTVRVGGFGGTVGSGTLMISIQPLPPNCGASGHDCCTEGPPTCDDLECCTIVCAIDPFCCGTWWDSNCILEAQELCTDPALECTPCLGDPNKDDGNDVDDLLLVINTWGVCAKCAADLNVDGTVDVDDLLAVINNWGPCS